MINFINTGLDDNIIKSIGEKHPKVIKEILVHGQHGDYYAKKPVNADTDETSSPKQSKKSDYVPMDMKQGDWVDRGMSVTQKDLYKNPGKVAKDIETYLSKFFDESGKSKYQTLNLSFSGCNNIEDSDIVHFTPKNPGDFGDWVKSAIKKNKWRAKVTSIAMSPGKNSHGQKEVQITVKSLDAPKNAEPEFTELKNKLQDLPLLQGYKILQYKGHLRIVKADD